MSITVGIFEWTINRRLFKGFMIRSSPAVKPMLSVVYQESKVLYLKEQPGWRSEAEGRKREERAKHSWLQVEQKEKAVQAFRASALFGGCAPFFFPFCFCCRSLWNIVTCWFQAPSHSFLISCLVHFCSHNISNEHQRKAVCYVNCLLKWYKQHHNVSPCLYNVLDISMSGEHWI